MKKEVYLDSYISHVHNVSAFLFINGIIEA